MIGELDISIDVSSISSNVQVSTTSASEVSVSFNTPFYAKTITVYEQESFTDVGDWFVYVSLGSQGSTALTAGETAPGSSNSDWLKLYYDQDHNDTHFSWLALGINEAELGLVDGDLVTFTADIYLDGPWGVNPPDGIAPGERRMVFGQTFNLFSEDVPAGQETSLSLPDLEFDYLSQFRPVGANSVTPPLDGDTGEGFAIMGWLPEIVKAGCSMYLRNIKITVERHPKVDLTLPTTRFDAPTVDLNVEYVLVPQFGTGFFGDQGLYYALGRSSDISINDVFSVDSIVSTTTAETLDVKVLRLLELNTVLDLNADTYVSGEDWVDDANGLVFTAFDSPVKTSDGYVRVGNGIGHFDRICVTVPEGSESDLDAYVKDPYVFYDSSFTIEFAFKYSSGVNYLIPIGTATNLDNFKFFGYTNYFTTPGGGGWNFGTQSTPKIVGSYPDGTPTSEKLRLPFGFNLSVFAGPSSGNDFGGSTPPYSSLINSTADAGVQVGFDFGIPDNGIQSDYEELKCQIIFDIENRTTTLYVNGQLLETAVDDKGIGLAGATQLFRIGKNMQGGWSSPKSIDVRRLRIYDSALRGAFIAESLDSL